MAEGYARVRQRDEYGGFNWGAAFFGWLVAIGLGALLTAFLSAAGTAIAISEIDTTTASDAETIGIVGAVLVLAVALISYFAGGYVAGRMSRFDGGRQGLGVWIWSIVAVVILAILGAIAGGEYNLFANLELPRVPVDEGDLTTGGVLVLLALAITTVLAAIAGGKAGERYHRRVDAVGADAIEDRREAEREDRARESDGRRGPLDRARTRTKR